MVAKISPLATCIPGSKCVDRRRPGMGIDTEIRFWGGASIWPLRMISLLKGNLRKLSKRMPALVAYSSSRARSRVPGSVRGKPSPPMRRPQGCSVLQGRHLKPRAALSKAFEKRRALGVVEYVDRTQGKKAQTRFSLGAQSRKSLPNQGIVEIHGQLQV